MEAVCSLIPNPWCRVSVVKEQSFACELYQAGFCVPEAEAQLKHKDVRRLLEVETCTAESCPEVKLIAAGHRVILADW